MGIKCLLKFINEFSDIIKVVDKNSLKNKRIAIDISILIYRTIISVRSSGADFKNEEGAITSHILGLFNKTIELLNMGIIPVYVFDGKPPSIKYKTIEERKDTRKKALEKMNHSNTDDDKIKYFKRSSQVTHEQWEQCKELLDTMGIPYINAPEEADSQCAYLVKMGLVDSVLTEDLDILTFGSLKIIRNITSYKIETTEIVLKDLLDKLELTYDQFIDFCILLGTDYNCGFIDVKPRIIYEHYKKHKNINNTIESMKKENIKISEDININEIKSYFIKPNINEILSEQLKLKEPNIIKLTKILIEKYGLIKYMIKPKLDKLSDFYTNLKNY